MNSRQSSFSNQSRVPGPLRPVQTISSWRPALAPAPQPFSRQHSPSGSLLNHSPSSSLQELDCLPRRNFSPYLLNHQPSYPISSAPSYIPTTAPLSQSLEPFGQESDLWTQSHLSFADTDWNLVSAHDSIPYPDIDVAINDLDYSITSTFTSISDSATNDPQSFAPSPLVPGSVNSQDGQSHPSPTSQIPGSASGSLPSPTTSQGDDGFGRVDSSRVEKRRLNTLAARRCRQRRADRMKTLEDELEKIRKERDELRLQVSKMEGETEALKGLLNRKSK